MDGGQFFKNSQVGGVAGLFGGFAFGRKLQVFEKNFGKLLCRIDIESLPGLIVDIFRELFELAVQLFGKFRQILGVHANALFLHCHQDSYERQFYVIVQLLQFQLVEPGGQSSSQPICVIGVLGRIERRLINVNPGK